MKAKDKPLFPDPTMTLLQRARCGARLCDAVLKQLKPSIKRDGWKRSSAWVFKAQDDWYLTAFIHGAADPDGPGVRIQFEFGVKPMAVDPIHWRVHRMEDNLKAPLSFRSNAAYKVPALPVGVRIWTDALKDVDLSAALVRDALDEMAARALAMVATTPFSDIVRAHEIDAKSHALLWASLIAENKGEGAMTLIRTHYLTGDAPPDARRRAIEIVADYQRVVDAMAA